MARKETERFAQHDHFASNFETNDFLDGTDVLMALSDSTDMSTGIDARMGGLTTRRPARLDVSTASNESDNFLPTHILAQADAWKL